MAVTQVNITRKDGDQTTYKVYPETVVEYEETYDKSVGDIIRMKELYWIAWHAETVELKSQGKPTLLFEDWVKTVAEVERVEEDEKKARTGAARSRS